MRASSFAIAVAAFGLATAGTALSAHADCDGFWPPKPVSFSQKRTVTAQDLVALRDIGSTESDDPSSELMAVSPDGRRIAFQLRQAVPTTNAYCLAMVVVDIATGASKVVDRGGTIIRRVQSIHGLTDYPSGFVEPIVPQWSPDGRSIAYLRQDGGDVQVWRASIAGEPAAPMTRLSVRPEAFAWTADGKGIVVASRPGTSVAEAAIEDEGRSGFVFDDRFVPFASKRPYPHGGAPLVYSVVELATGQSRTATPSEMQTLKDDEASPQGAFLSDRNGAGTWAWSEPQDAGHINSPTRIKVGAGPQANSLCSDERCDRVRGLLWAPGGHDVVWVNREGDDYSRLSLYRGSVATGKIQKLFETDDAILGCAAAQSELVCARETSTRPRGIVAVDLETGLDRTIFDPNPEFESLQLGSVQRIRWKNNLGISTFGDLVLPPDREAGKRYPLIVVGYSSRGFLRGGTGDEYPIQLFAARGFAVLSVQTAVTPGYLAGPATWNDAIALDLKDWTFRKSDLSSVEAGVAAAIATGSVDGGRVGMTGLSDGASGAQFDLINSHLFKAAVVSTCCDESFVVNVLDGDGPLRWYSGVGFPKLTDPSESFWHAMSFRQNADTMATPLLMQLPDFEFLGGMESYRALREHNQPVDLVVFPDEYHFKWQPAHRLALYQRNVDWFEFWLNDKLDADPAKASQNARWQALKAATSQSSSASPGG